MITGIAQDVTVVGGIEIGILLDKNGLGFTYGLDGIEPEAAIGYLQVVQDRLRTEVAEKWDLLDVDDEDDLEEDSEL